MTTIEDFKKSINNALKEIQKTGKHPVPLNEGTQKSLNGFQKKANKKGKEFNKTLRDLKMEIDTIKNS